MDPKELRRKIETFSLDDGDLGNQGYKRVLLQLFGYSGHGKSSFINSCKYILNDGVPFVKHAKSGGIEDGGSMTLIRKSYQLTPNITIVDNRGCNKMTTFERAEVYAQLGNFYPLDQKVEWKENFKEVISAVEDSDLNKNTTDFLVPIFIFSSEYYLPSHEKKDLISFFENCKYITGVFPIVVLTKKNRGDFLEAKNRFLHMGAEAVYPIENYTETSNVKTLERSTDILKIIVKALENVTFRMSLPRHPEEERKNRKKFLYNYIHEAEIKDEKAKTKAEEGRWKQKKNNMTQDMEKFEYSLPSHGQKDVRGVGVGTNKILGNVLESEKKIFLMGAEAVCSTENYRKTSTLRILQSAVILWNIPLALVISIFRLILPGDPERDQI